MKRRILSIYKHISSTRWGELRRRENNTDTVRSREILRCPGTKRSTRVKRCARCLPWGVRGMAGSNPVSKLCKISEKVCVCVCARARALARV